ncbi:hypothetical protein JCM5350_008175 [Sporobolomyces pararoseus]
MSFSSLPPELVHQIIASTVPHTFHSRTYHERQRILCRLSLVSKLFRSIAQRLLFEIVRLPGLKAAEELPGNRALEGNVPTHLIYLQVTDFGKALGSKAIGAVHLPNLRDLTLWDVSSELFLALTDPAAVPNLRNLAFVDTGLANDAYVSESRCRHLLPQLDTLTLTKGVWLNSRASFLHSAASRTLIDFYTDDDPGLAHSQGLVIHVRLKGSTTRLRYFDRWSTLVRTSPCLSLQSIYLDSSLQHISSLPVAAQTPLIDFIRVCGERKVEIVFETPPSDFTVDPFISSEFVRRQKEQRRKEPGRRRT